MVLIESSEILSTLKLLRDFSEQFRFHEASEAYLNMVRFIQTMEKEKEDHIKYKSKFFQKPLHNKVFLGLFFLDKPSADIDKLDTIIIWPNFSEPVQRKLSF